MISRRRTRAAAVLRGDVRRNIESSRECRLLLNSTLNHERHRRTVHTTRLLLVARTPRAVTELRSARARDGAVQKLSGDKQCIVFSQLCNVLLLDLGTAVAFG